MPDAAHCPDCGHTSPPLPQANGDSICAACGATVRHEAKPKLPDTSELPKAKDDIIGTALITELASGRREGGPLDSDLVKTTSHEEAGGVKSSRRKAKRPSRRAAELVDWDGGNQPKATKLRSGDRRRRLWKARIIKFSAAAAAVALLCLVAYGIIVATRDPAPVAKPDAESGFTPLDFLGREDRAAATEKIDAVIAGFLSADTLEKRISYVYDPGNMRPLMEARQSREPITPIQTRDRLDGQRYQSKGSLIATNLLLDDFSVKPIALRQLSEDEFKVDWESFVGHCEMPWEQIPIDRPTTPFMARVKISPDARESATYDRAGWRCWRLENDNSGRALVGFTSIGSVAETELMIATHQQTKGPSPFVLKVVFPEGASVEDEVEIVEVLAAGWVLSENQ